MVQCNLPKYIIDNGSLYTKNDIERDFRLVNDFKFIDSIVLANKHKKHYLTFDRRIGYIEEKTGMEATTDGSSFGRMGFNRIDWIKWHQWFNRNFHKNDST